MLSAHRTATSSGLLLREVGGVLPSFDLVPGRTLKEGTSFCLSRSLGDRFFELVWEGLLTPWAVDHLTVNDGRVASWPIILATLRWERGLPTSA